MSDDPNGESDPNASSREGESRGFRLKVGLRVLSDVLGALVEVDRRNAPPPSDPVEWEAVTESDADAPEEAEPRSTERVRKSTTDRCLVDTRFEGDEFVVHADIPGASTDEVSVGLDTRTDQLVIAETGSVLGRVDLPWSSPEATAAWFNNGVLEVRLRPTDG